MPATLPDSLKELENGRAKGTRQGPSNGAAEPPSYEGCILDAEAFCRLQIPEKKFYLHPVITEQSICFVTAPRGIGKTMFVLGIADAITKGAKFGPWETQNPANVLFLDAEMPAQDVIQRLNDLGHYGRKAKLSIYSDHYNHLNGLKRASLLDPKWREGIQKLMMHHEIKLWICDNLASLTPGQDENSKSEWDPINQWLLGLRFNGISSIIVHHEGKGGTQRGTSAREDNADMCITLKKPTDYNPEQGVRFVVAFSKSRVRMEYLHLIAETEFSLMKTMGDTYEWTWKTVKGAIKTRVLEMLDDHIPAKDIATLCGVSGARVSQIKAEAIKNCWMTRGGSLTQLGHSRLCGTLDNDFTT